MEPIDLMSRPVTEFLTETKTFSPTDKVSQVIGFMAESKSYEVFIEEDEKTFIVSIRDLLNVTSLDTKLETQMHRVPRLNKQNTVSDAAALMFEYRSRSMPIYQANDVVGQVTSPSIVASLVDSSLNLKLSTIMTRNPIVATPTTSVGAVRDLMMRKKFDQVPVVEGEAPVGIITSDELVFNLMPKAAREMKGDREGGRYGETAGAFSSDGVVTNAMTDSLDNVYRNMSGKEANYSLIVVEGKLQGIITYRDFMTVLRKKASSQPVPMYIVGLPDDEFEASAVRRKFLESVQLLRRSLPDVSEARAIIKTGDIRTGKKKSQVKVLILTPTKLHSFSVSSYSLADSFEEVHNWIKKVVTQEKRGRERPTSRHQIPDESV